MNIDKFGRHLTIHQLHQMSVDKFGRHINSRNVEPPIVHHQERGFPITADGNFNVNDKRLCNVATPIDKKDSANKSYVDKTFEALQEHLKKASTGPNLNVKHVSDIFTLKLDLDKLKKTHDEDIQRLNKAVDELEDTLRKVDDSIRTNTKPEVEQLRRDVTILQQHQHQHTYNFNQSAPTP